jgi:hypothetical protein
MPKITVAAPYDNAPQQHDAAPIDPQSAHHDQLITAAPADGAA